MDRVVSTTSIGNYIKNNDNSITRAYKVVEDTFNTIFTDNIETMHWIIG